MTKINITAETVKEFNKINDHIKSLPDTISCQIEKGEYGLIGFDYTIRDRFGSTEPIVYIPNNVKQIKAFPNNIIIYCDGYILRINGELMKKPLHYVFVCPTINADKHP